MTLESGTHIYLIAGEASGDFIGAQLMKALKKRDADVRFSGIGGPLMEEQGLKSFFPMDELSLMGVAEILPRLPALIRRIKQTVKDITLKKPDVLLTVDAPDFGLRVQKTIRKTGAHRPLQMHYVAPTVWAWRAGRAKKIARYLDSILCLFPFEPPYFEAQGLEAEAVGHPVIETNIVSCKKMTLDENALSTVGLLFGSRHSELQRHGDIILKAALIIKEAKPDVRFVVPTLPRLENDIQTLCDNYGIKAFITTSEEEKFPALKACDYAIAVSGTVGLQLAVADVPHLICYRMSALTFSIVRYLIKTPYAHLANITLNRPLVPEFIQQDCTSRNLARTTLDALENPEIIAQQKKGFATFRQSLGELQNPSEHAADYLLAQLAQSR